MATTTLDQTTTFNQTLSADYPQTITRPSVFTNLITLCENQQYNRFLWLSIAISVHGCFLTPLTMMIVVVAGINLVLFTLTIAAMAMTLITNLAALPTKITIPVFIFSVLLDLGILVAVLFV